ncbi:phosphatidylglycerophosphatase [Sulfurovum lithotrophicum]|uniref:Phosphatidylglycerophosphatase n=1 Tax=Sulfurovum lithotrophicum TaxID=206403 RepID=A0A7U4M212_9BACT|nr:phosphatidylglycerophosphatase A [Sulfurovum lithotrophicum]AKF25428.1 phosphatidylglycerophosphatase [Sulfurovum lithotrophicum]
MTVQTLFLTFLGTGLSPKAPKAAGTLAALIVGMFILYYLGMDTLFMLTFAVTVIGIFEINKYENSGGEHNAKEIVIDEAAGMWMSLMIALSTAETLNYPYATLFAVFFSFVAFRLFDSWKPSTIGWIHREVKGGLGVMMDDMLSGIAGGLLSVVLLMGIGKLF